MTNTMDIIITMLMALIAVAIIAYHWGYSDGFASGLSAALKRFQEELNKRARSGDYK